MTDSTGIPKDTSNTAGSGSGSGQGSDATTGSTAPTTPLGTPTSETPPATPAPEPAAMVLPKRRRPLFPTILWGALMLALAAFISARELVPGGFDFTTWLLTAVVGIGILLIVAGIAAASRRAG